MEPYKERNDRPLSRGDHLDFTPFQLIVTKLKLDVITVWYHVCAMKLLLWKQGT